MHVQRDKKYIILVNRFTLCFEMHCNLYDEPEHMKALLFMMSQDLNDMK